MIEHLHDPTKMLLAITKDNQSYDSIGNSLYSSFNGGGQSFAPTYQAIHPNQTQYSYIQPSLRSTSQQNFTTLSIRARRRRTSHSVVATMDPVAVARRNERERNRVKQVNDGFSELRKKIPYIPDKKKFSKVEILRFAMMYIKELQGLIDGSSFDDAKSEKSSSTDEYMEDDRFIGSLQ